MKKNLTTLFGALMALALLASACGGDDASAADQEVIEAVSAQLRSEGGFPDGFDVDCMSTAMVAGLGGAEAMDENYGLTAATIAAGQEPDDVELPVDEARSMGAAMMDCGFDELMASSIGGDDISEEDAKCLLDNLDSDAIRDAVAVGFMNDADAARIGATTDEIMESSVVGAMTECGLFG